MISYANNMTKKSGDGDDDIMFLVIFSGLGTEDIGRRLRLPAPNRLHRLLDAFDNFAKTSSSVQTTESITLHDTHGQELDETVLDRAIREAVSTPHRSLVGHDPVLHIMMKERHSVCSLPRVRLVGAAAIMFVLTVLITVLMLNASEIATLRTKVNMLERAAARQTIQFSAQIDELHWANHSSHKTLNIVQWKHDLVSEKLSSCRTSASRLAADAEEDEQYAVTEERLAVVTISDVIGGAVKDVVTTIENVVAYGARKAVKWAAKAFDFFAEFLDALSGSRRARRNAEKQEEWEKASAALEKCQSVTVAIAQQAEEMAASRQRARRRVRSLKRQVLNLMSVETPCDC